MELPFFTFNYDIPTKTTTTSVIMCTENNQNDAHNVSVINYVFLAIDKVKKCGQYEQKVLNTYFSKLSIIN